MSPFPLQLLESRTLFSTNLQIGAIDPRFASNGTSQITFPNEQFTPGHLITESDGKTVIAGTVTPNSGGNSDFIVIRLNADGSLDPTFGNGGEVTIDFRSTNDSAANVIQQSDGKLVVIGSSQNPDNTIVGGLRNSPDLDVAVARLNADGSLDPSFGTGGKTTIDLAHRRFEFYQGQFDEEASIDNATAAAEARNGQLIISGTTFADQLVAGDMFVMRLNANGAVDESFGLANSGLTIAQFLGDTVANAMLIQHDGKIVVAGADSADMQTQMAMIRLDSSGHYDRKFGKGGALVMGFSQVYDSIFSLAEQPDHKLLAGGVVTFGSLSDGSASGQLALVRMLSNGSPDKKFGTPGLPGLALTEVPNEQLAGITSIKVQSDGKILAGGRAGDTTAHGLAFSRSVVLARYLSNGHADTSFGTNGLTTVLPPDSIASFDPTSVTALELDAKYRDFLSDGQGAITSGPTNDILTLASSTPGQTNSNAYIAAVLTDGVDLTGTITPKVPKNPHAGTKATATLTVTNSGTLPAIGKVSVAIYLSTSQSISDSDQPITTTLLTANIKPGQSKKYTLKFTLPANLAPGNYHVLARINSTNSIPEINTANNDIFSTTQITTT